jgi:hypothetical protein
MIMAVFYRRALATQHAGTVLHGLLLGDAK